MRRSIVPLVAMLTLVGSAAACGSGSGPVDGSGPAARDAALDAQSTGFDAPAPVDETAPSLDSTLGGDATPSDDGTTGPGDAASPTDAALSGDADDDAGSPAPDAAVDDVTLPTICPDGGSSAITGHVYAPNGTDPIPHVLVYAVDDSTTFPPGPTSVTCQHCVTPPPALARTLSATDGSFSLWSTALDAGGTFTIVLVSGGWRRVIRGVTAAPCSHVALTAAQTSFAGASRGDDLVPRIAVAGLPTHVTGDVNDRFVTVLGAIGITAYDLFDPDKNGAPVTTGPDLLTLLSSAPMLDRYQMLIVPCGSAGNFSVTSHLSAAAIANLSTWLTAGGRLYSSDLAYPVIAQTFPAAINWAPGPSSRAGADPADVGVGIASGTSTPAAVIDTDLLAWLRAVGATSGTTIPVFELRDPWGAIDTLPTAETTPDAMGAVHGRVEVSGSVSWHSGTTTTPPAGHPLTAVADFPGSDGHYCGRVAFTSYHVQSTTSGTTLTPQERVLEYLFFQLTTCVQ